MMGFTGFPTETEEGNRCTIDFLRGRQDWWTVAAIGDFVLTPGAIVGAKPEEFGITIVPPNDEEFISRTLRYDEYVATDKRLGDIGIDKRVLSTTDFDRPFAGGVDSAHSIFFYDRYGPKFPRSIVDKPSELDESAIVRLNGVICTGLPFPAIECLDPADLAEVHKRGSLGGREFRYQNVINWLKCAEGWVSRTRHAGR